MSRSIGAKAIQKSNNEGNSREKDAMIDVDEVPFGSKPSTLKVTSRAGKLLDRFLGSE